ncbi:hypothetical protein C8R45DRAFT_1099146 [Mycena sanguinolenta]|nr:hypothetical protein C8R45DRAFT_1099146 [Mycena sanguinolenta]
MAGVDLLFGPMLIGVILNMMLYESVVTWNFIMFRYFQRFPKGYGPSLRAAATST